MPLVMTKEALDKGAEAVSIRVDNETAVKNVSRLGEKMNLEVSVQDIEGGFLVSLSGNEGGHAAAEIDEADLCCVPAPAGSGYAVFVGKDHLGEGDPQLGFNLVKMALYVLSSAEEAPASLLFMNGGVKLVCSEEEQIIESVKTMIGRGTEVLVCGTCLDFYGVKEQLKVGEISNMYDILGRMHKAAKVITL